MCCVSAFRDKTVLNTFNAWISLSLGKGGLEKNLTITLSNFSDYLSFTQLYVVQFFT